jgi:hypothetical protein
MRAVRLIYQAIFIAITIAFALCGVGLVVLAVLQMVQGMFPSAEAPSAPDRFNTFLEAIAILTIAVASLELSQTVLEEEVMRDMQISGPTRVRRFLSRFMVVVVVASAVEFLVAIFELLHSDRDRLPHAAAIGVGSAALLLAWGAFVRWNRHAEELEPDGLRQAKSEDHKVEK